MDQKYYDGVDEQSEEPQTFPTYPYCAVTNLFVLHVGPAHAGNKQGGGVSRTYLLPGVSESQVVVDFIGFCRAAVDDVRHNMDEADMTKSIHTVCPEVLDARARRVTQLEAHLVQLGDNLTRLQKESPEADKLSEFRQLRDERKQLLNELEAATEVVTRFEAIVKPLRQLIGWLESGWYVIQPISGSRPIPVRMFDDWHGFTAYHKKELLL